MSHTDTSTTLVVTTLEADAHRLAVSLGATTSVHVKVGTDELLATYLDVRPDVVVVDLLDDVEELAAIIAQLGAIGFDNEAVPILAITDSTDQALASLEAGARDAIDRDHVATAILGSRVASAVALRSTAIRLRRQRAGLADVVMLARQRSTDDELAITA